MFLVIYFENYKDCLFSYEDFFMGKVVVDIFNRLKVLKYCFNVEYFSCLLFNVNIVKGFNVILVYVMENEFVGGSYEVFIVGDDFVVWEKVCVLVRDMGFVVSDWGLL